MKHLMPGIAPMVGLMRVYFMPHMIAPTPASAEPMKKVMAMVRFRSIPIRLGRVIVAGDGAHGQTGFCVLDQKQQQE